MNYKIEEVEGIGSTYGKKLVAAGVKTTGGLLSKAASRKGRKDLAEASGISEKLILEWVNLADLMRINGIGKQFAELLEASGVDTIKELRNRKPASLAAKVKEVNAAKKLSRSTPAESMIQKWVAEAKTIKPAVTY